MAKLSEAERKTLNAAEQILLETLVPGEVLMFSLHHGWSGISATYFSPHGAQHGLLGIADDPTLAGKVQRALAIRADEEARAGQIKAERVAKLKAELQSLEEAA